MQGVSVWVKAKMPLPRFPEVLISGRPNADGDDVLALNKPSIFQLKLIHGVV